MIQEAYKLLSKLRLFTLLGKDVYLTTEAKGFLWLASDEAIASLPFEEESILRDWDLIENYYGGYIKVLPPFEPVKLI